MTTKKRMTIAIICGLMGALCAGLFLWNQATSIDRERTKLVGQFESESVRVLVARKRIESGTILNVHLFDEQVWPGLFLPEGTILAEHLDEVVGRRAIATILAGEPLAAARIFEEQLPLDRLTQGMTAVTLPTDAVHALGGEVIVGMRVTLMGALPDGRIEAIATNIEVLSANTEGNPDVDIRWVTLALPDTQVSQILAAAQARTLHMVLPKAAEANQEPEGGF